MPTREQCCEWRGVTKWKCEKVSLVTAQDSCCTQFILCLFCMHALPFISFEEKESHLIQQYRRLQFQNWISVAVTQIQSQSIPAYAVRVALPLPVGTVEEDKICVEWWFVLSVLWLSTWTIQLPTSISPGIFPFGQVCRGSFPHMWPDEEWETAS